jgi:hypothetical protein
MLTFLKIIVSGFVAVFIAFVGAFHSGTQQPSNPTQATSSAIAMSAPPSAGVSVSATINTAPVSVPKTNSEKQSPSHTSSQNSVNVTPSVTSKAIVTTTAAPQTQPTPSTQAAVSTVSVCPAIELDFYNSVYNVWTAEGQVSALLQLINATVNSANQIENSGNISSAYQQYSSADSSVTTQMNAISAAANSINADTTYENNANLVIAQSDLLTAAADYDSFYKDARSATADLAEDPTDSVAQNNYTDGIDNAESEGRAASTEYGLASTTFATLWAEDSRTKTQNGCNPAGLWVYSDIANKVNNGLDCTKDGYTTGLDGIMCQLYDEGSVTFRSNGYWAIIDRPAQ